jgi:hypothetical protein
MVKYIIRLDDACPTMDWQKWNRMINILEKYNVKPIIAVIPDNEDKSLEINKPMDDFWGLVKKWHNKSYHIAMHGYNHVYISKEKGLVPFNSRSEFAGVPYKLQKEKIVKSWEIFRSKDLIPNIWVAPAHSFDINTLKILKTHTSISIVSDGLARKPFVKYDFVWIPQQLWKPRLKKNGVWTICYHPNTMNEDGFTKLEDFIKDNYKYFNVELNTLISRFETRKKSLTDSFFEFNFFVLRNLKKVYSRL